MEGLVLGSLVLLAFSGELKPTFPSSSFFSILLAASCKLVRGRGGYFEGFLSLLPLALLGRWLAASAQLAAAVFEFTILRDGKLGGIGGGDAIADLHAVALLHLCQGTHQPRVGRVQGHDPLLLQQTPHKVRAPSQMKCLCPTSLLYGELPGRGAAAVSSDDF